MPKKRPDIADIVLNGTQIHAAIIGDGWQQIDLFKEIEEYKATHKFAVRTQSRPIKPNGMREDYVVATSDRYNIVVVKTHVPGVPTEFITHRYKMQVEDKQTKKEHRHMGTIAHHMFDMISQIKENQK
jgi:hypothetical protein